MTLAIFGINNSGISLAVNLLILFLVVIYLALVAWVYLDAKRRLEDPVLVGCAAVAALIPLAGPIVYSILRPPELLADARERELEIRASELRVRQLEEASCPNCEHPVERTYLRCPGCRARIKDPCESCGKPVDPRWTLCPYCETPNRRAQAASKSPPKRRGLSGRKSSSRPSPSTGEESEVPAKSARTGRAQRSPASVRSSETRPLKTLPDSEPKRSSSSSSAPSKRSASSSSSTDPSSSQPDSGSGSGSSRGSSPTRRSSSSRERPEPS